jgi:hypothetical protein
MLHKKDKYLCKSKNLRFLRTDSNPLFFSLPGSNFSKQLISKFVLRKENKSLLTQN